ncbi:hypothetical protein PG995_006581 [Apiospora arundinis]
MSEGRLRDELWGASRVFEFAKCDACILVCMSWWRGNAVANMLRLAVAAFTEDAAVITTFDYHTMSSVSQVHHGSSATLLGCESMPIRA